MRISARNRSAPSAAAELGMQHLDRDAPVVPDVVREIDGGHAAGAELALDAIATRQLRRQAEQIFGGWDGGHGANMRSSRGIL